MIEASVVICFRDWGLDRLALALKSHAESTMGDRLEIIVSDYGSADGESVRKVVEAHGAVLARTEVQGPWSRSRALNAGVAHARGRYVITTDADMLFTPQAHEVICTQLREDPRSAQLLQCRDLNQEFNASAISGFEWARYEQGSTLRPRWGMGGMIAFEVRAYDAIRGYDERMEIYGGEDIDFANRMRRAGQRLNWIDDIRCRIFHIWHESSRKAADETSEGRTAINRNRDIVLNDRTWVRNLEWKYRRSSAPPLVTISIATCNRAEFLRDCLRSVLMQSVQDFEVVIVDDGSTDHTRSVVESFGDARFHYVYQENQGVSVARNRALAEAKADFVLIQDDDDIMLPWRIESHFRAMSEGMHGTYGGWVDFQDATGELVARPGRAFGIAQMLYSGGVMAHGTLMIRTDVIRQFGYDPALRAGTDFNLAIRMTVSGVRLGHAGQFHILRRFHGGNLTDTISDHQKESARRTTGLFRRRYSPSSESAMREVAKATDFAACHGETSLRSSVAQYLPDRLVSRDAWIRFPGPEALRAIEQYAAGNGLVLKVFHSKVRGGEVLDGTAGLFGVSLDQSLELLKAGFCVQLEVATIEGQAETDVGPSAMVFSVADLMTDPKRFYCVLALAAEDENASMIWGVDADTHRLVIAGGKPYAVSVSSFGSLDEAASFDEEMRGKGLKINSMVLQRAV